MIYDDSMLMLETFAACVAPAPMTLDAAGLTGNGSVYACLLPASGEQLRLLDLVLAADPPFDPATLREEAHVTLVYSRSAGIDLERFRHSYMANMSLKPVSAAVECVEHWDGHNGEGYVVFKLHSPEAAGINGVLVACGAKHSFDDYQAHMTIAGKVGPRTGALAAWMERINAVLRGTCVEVCFDRIKFEDIDESR